MTRSPAAAPTAPAPRPAGIDITTQDLARPAAVMAVGTTLSRVTGLGRTVALAFALGVAESRLADSYNIANTLPNVLYELVLGGVLTSIFIPLVVTQLRTKETDDAWKGISALISCAMVVLLACTLLVMVAAPWSSRSSPRRAAATPSPSSASWPPSSCASSHHRSRSTASRRSPPAC